MNYSKHSMNQKSRNTYVAEWSHKEGVFITPRGKYIARVRVGHYKIFTTISQHDSETEAQKAYNKFYDELR